MKKLHERLSKLLILALLSGMLPVALAEQEDVLSMPVEETVVTVEAELPGTLGVEAELMIGEESDEQANTESIDIGAPIPGSSEMAVKANEDTLYEMEYKGHRYVLYTKEVTIFDAISDCKKLGGHLLTMSTKAEMEAVRSFRAKNGYGSVKLWCGAIRNKDGSWEWMTGESNKASNGDVYFGVGTVQYNGFSSYEGGVYPQYSSWENYYAYQENANLDKVKHGYICEWDYTAQVSVEGASITLSKTRYSYNGKACKPGVTVTLNGSTLKKGTDYTVGYKNNIDIGTPEVKITGKGVYKDTTSKSFKIVPATPKLSVSNKNACSADLSASSVAGATGYEFRYKKDGYSTEKVKRSSKNVLKVSSLSGGKKYTFRVRAYATVNGKRVYGGYSATKTVTISKGKDITGAKLTIGNKNMPYVYTGNAVKPDVKVKLGLFTLKKDTDYILTWSDNVDAGTAKVTATGIGKYVGKLEGTFVIDRAPLKNDYFLLEKTAYTYNGSAIKPKVGGVFNKRAMIKNTDFKLSYSNNTDAGTATAKITGKGNFAGTVEKTFTIKPLSITKCNVSLPDGDSYAYTGEAIQPKVEVKKGDTVLPSGSYSVSYANNTEIGTASAVISGTGNLKGKVTLTFEITQPFKWPLRGSWYYTQKFGNYYEPKAKEGRPYHTAPDLKSNDLRVFAFAEGDVMYAGHLTASGKESSNGYHVVLKHTINGQTVYSLYSHMVAGSLLVEKGDHVNTETQLGTMGMTGSATGVHLHFSIFTGYSSDPVGYAAKGGSDLILTYKNSTFYNPEYVIEHGKLPE